MQFANGKRPGVKEAFPRDEAPARGADKADSFSPNAYPSSETIPATHLAYVAAHYPGVEDRCGRS